jgi:tetratricopeptide (TPR) repeat protein
MASLASPLALSALPLRVATFALNGQGPEAAKVQLLIHADIGVNYSSAMPVSLAYMITDLDGSILESQTANARLAPVMNGVPSPLQFTGGASVPPGEYILKLAVAEGDLVGSIEHRIHATLLNIGRINFSELMVGGPANAAPLLRPTIGHTVSFGNVQGYLEAYGPGVKELKIIYEIANSLDGPPILNADVPAQPGGGDRAIFSRVMAVRQLPPGAYVLRALISADAGLDKSPVTMARAIEIAPPAVLMASVDNAPAPPLSATELFLPVGEEIFARSFHRDQVARPAILQAFRGRLAPASVASFDRGVALLAAGDYAKAEISFKEAIHPDGDSAAPLTYLAAAFAAAGHDREAASAWQMALIDGTDVPEIYQWLSDALLRTHDLPQARAILEEAVAKWPADSRFAKPLAMLYGTFGLGREAVRTLARHLDAHPDDVEGLSMGVEWIYNLHSLGAVARSRGEDVKLARTYAAAYERAKGPQVELVKQWIGFIEGRTP